MKSNFTDCNQLFIYDSKVCHETFVEATDKLIKPHAEHIYWLNIYGFEFFDQTEEIISTNGFDEFLRILFQEEEQRNKMIDLDGSLYLTINVLVYKNEEFEYDRIRFYFTENLLWTVQEKDGDYFDSIRDYIRNNKGIVRKRKADYLLFKMLDAILDNYDKAYDSFQASAQQYNNINEVKPNPEFVLEIEQLKQKLLLVKNALLNIREVLTQLEKWDNEEFNNHYFEVLKEQSNLLIDEIDMNLQFQESNLNLIFNLQGHRLNEIMNTLTVFSVIFIPITFITGLYGMNFVNMPELNWPYGYFVVLGLMFVLTAVSLIIIKRKKWF